MPQVSAFKTTVFSAVTLGWCPCHRAGSCGSCCCMGLLLEGIQPRQALAAAEYLDTCRHRGNYSCLDSVFPRIHSEPPQPLPPCHPRFLTHPWFLHFYRPAPAPEHSRLHPAAQTPGLPVQLCPALLLHLQCGDQRDADSGYLALHSA